MTKINQLLFLYFKVISLCHISSVYLWVTWISWKKYFEVSFLHVQWKNKRVTPPAEDDNYTGCKDDDSALMASWWDQALRNYFQFLCANVHQAYFAAIYLQEHYSPDMVNDLSIIVWESVPGAKNCGQPIWLKVRSICMRKTTFATQSRLHGFPYNHCKV